MNTRRIAFLLSAFLTLAASFSYAASIKFNSSPESRVWISGKSTLHPFIIKASTFNLQMVFKAASLQGASVEILKGHSAHLTATVPIKGLRSEFEVMDENIQRAMKASRYPNIVFSLKSYSVSTTGPKKTISVPGSLSISGVSKPVILNATINLSGSDLSISGSQSVKMSAYGITPPTMMFGSIKVDDFVIVHYHLVLSPLSSE